MSRPTVLRGHTWWNSGSYTTVFGLLSLGSSDLNRIRLSGVSSDIKSTPYVDSVCSLGHGLVAAKCVDHGKILVFKADFPNLGKDTKVEVKTLLVFAWRKTKEFFMNIGGLSSLNLLACGDDQGFIWINEIPSWVTDGSSQKPKSLPQKVSPLGL